MCCRDEFNAVTGKPGLECPNINANTTYLPVLSSVSVPPAYFDFPGNE